jgi:hypothetical protein
MDAIPVNSLITGLLGGAGGAVGAWAAIMVHLGYHRRDIERAQHTADRAHKRLDGLRCGDPRSCDGVDERGRAHG